MTATATTNARTKAEREQMLAQVQRAIRAEVRRSGIIERHHEDVEQDIQLAVWVATEKFDPNRGAQWSTYAIGVIKNVVKNWKTRHHYEDDGSVWNKDHEYFDRLPWPQDHAPPGPHDDDDESLDGETVDALAAGVRRVLAGGVLAQLGAGHRRLVGMVVFDRLSPDQIATQLGHPLKAVRCNLKAALRALCRNGATSHAATDREIADATAPQKPTGDREQQREANRKRSQLVAAAQVVKQLDAAAGEDGFQMALARLDEDTRVVVLALIERSFTVDEAVELLGGKRKAVVSRLRNVAKAVTRKDGSTAATVDRRELVAR